MYYRYHSPDYNCGIFVALETFLESMIVDRKEIDRLCLEFTAIFEDELPLPDPRGICYFTEKGNRKFHKAIIKMSNYLKRNGVNIVCDTLKDVSDKTVLYMDKYQIVLQKDEVKNNG